MGHAARKCRFQQITSVHGAPGRGSGAHERVNLIDEQDCVRYLLEPLHTCFTRSSKSPRYLVPATGAEVERVHKAFLATSGTSP